MRWKRVMRGQARMQTFEKGGANLRNFTKGRVWILRKFWFWGQNLGCKLSFWWKNAWFWNNLPNYVGANAPPPTHPVGIGLGAWGTLYPPGTVLSIKQAENPAMNAGLARNIGMMLSSVCTPAKQKIYAYKWHRWNSYGLSSRQFGLNQKESGTHYHLISFYF